MVSSIQYHVSALFLMDLLNISVASDISQLLKIQRLYDYQVVIHIKLQVQLNEDQEFRAHADYMIESLTKQPS